MILRKKWIQVLSVLILPALLVVFVTPNFMCADERARISQSKQHIRVLTRLVHRYHLEHGAYPDTQTGLQALVDAGYVAKLSVDPWGRSYHYTYPGVRNPGSFDVFSYGEDGLEGGEEMDQDIYNDDEWM